MSEAPRKSRLSPARRQLLLWCQALNYGFIEDLLVRHGEPVLDPPPRRVRCIKFGAVLGPRREAARADVALPEAFVALLRFLDEFDTGRIDRLEVAGGLPHKLETTEPSYSS